jgi:hypothetical protein
VQIGLQVCYPDGVVVVGELVCRSIVSLLIRRGLHRSELGKVGNSIYCVTSSRSRSDHFREKKSSRLYAPNHRRCLWLSESYLGHPASDRGIASRSPRMDSARRLLRDVWAWIGIKIIRKFSSKTDRAN